jgi:hypothetical protein
MKKDIGENNGDNHSMIPSVHKAASIENSAPKLTKGENALLKAIKKHLEEDSVLTKDECIEIYKEHVFSGHQKVVSVYNIDTKKCENRLREVKDSEHRVLALQWLRSSLGNLILKEKLLIIPVIDV